jgi:hypothetical protein
MPAAAPTIAHRNPIQSVRWHLSRRASERRHRGRMQWGPPLHRQQTCPCASGQPLEQPRMGCGSTPAIPVAHVDGASGGALLLGLESGMLPPLAAHCHPRVPTGCRRMPQHNPIQSVCWHCPHKSRSGTLALLQIRVGKRVGHLRSRGEWCPFTMT